MRRKKGTGRLGKDISAKKVRDVSAMTFRQKKFETFRQIFHAETSRIILVLLDLTSL